MSKRQSNNPLVKPVSGKTVRVQVMLRPDLADRLKLAAMGLGVDLGDVVSAGLVEVLRNVTVSVTVRTPALSSAVESAGEDGAADGAAGLRVAG
jgi:hypothetical protein